MDKFLKKNWQIILIETLVVIIFTIFYGKFGDFVVDSFREAYIPTEMFDGKVIYKNIFTIYAPFSYLFNTFLYKIFGIGLDTLYFAGLCTTLGIFYITYQISNLFLNKNYTFSILIFMISAFVLSSNAFSPFFPYSYGILYGLFFILTSVYFGLNKNYPLAYLAYSFAICSKYEFIFLLPLLIFMSKKENLLKNIVYFIVPIITFLAILLAIGVRLSDLNATFQIINTMTTTKTLYWFYSVTGLTFRLELIPIYLTGIFKFLVPYSFNQWQEIFIWIFPVISIIYLLRFKALNNQERFFIAASILISIKVFFALTLQSYGTFFLPFALISFFILLNPILKKIFFVYLIIWSLIIGSINITNLIKKDTTVLDETVNYVLKETGINDKVVIYPEGLKVNFLTKRKSDDKFYSLIPLYVETFGEDIIIKRLSLTKPKYIVLTNYDTSSYYYRCFGEDYAINIKKWIKENYTLDTKTSYAEYYKLN